MVAGLTTWFGVLPPTVTVTVSIDCLPLAAVTTSSPHCVLVAPGAYCACCCRAQFGMLLGTVTVICVSLQPVMRACMGFPVLSAPMVTLAPFVQAPLTGEQLPKP